MWWKGGLGHDRAKCGGWVVCLGKICIFITEQSKKGKSKNQVWGWLQNNVDNSLDIVFLTIHYYMVTLNTK